MLIVGALLLAGTAAAQAPPKQKLPPARAVAETPSIPEVPFDIAAVAPRPAPEAALDRFRDDPAYRYEEVGAAGPSLVDLLWRWFVRTFLDPLRENTSPRFWRIFWPALAVLVLAWVLVRVLRTGGSGLFARRDAAAPEGALLLDADDIADVDLDGLLGRALAERRHRDAVRLLYLCALQALAAGGLVDWQKHKTNHDYLREVRRASGDLSRPFDEVTRLFEWVWYGEAPVDDARFAAVQARFDRFGDALRAATTPRRGRT
jgi:hypothetical protein